MLDVTGFMTIVGGVTGTISTEVCGTEALETQTANKTVSLARETLVASGSYLLPEPSAAVLHPPKSKPGFSRRPVLRATVRVLPKVNVTFEGSVPDAAPLGA